MKFTHIVLTAALLISSAAVTEAALADPPPGGMMGGGGGMRGMFTPEERLMMIADSFKATAGMTDDQKQAYRQQRRAQLMAMTDADRAKYKADLDKRWAALPPDQQAAIKAKVEAFMEARRNGGAGPSAQ